MTMTPDLKLPDFEKLFVLECDAPHVRIGVGVIQIQEGQPATFLGEKLSKGKKRRYLTYDLEFYALVRELLIRSIICCIMSL